MIDTVRTKESFAKEGYTYCGQERVSGRVKCKFICPDKHEGLIRLDHWNRGVRCASCAGNKKLSITKVRVDFKKEGYTLITKTYNNSNQILTTICPNGHTYKISRKNWSQGYRCSTCSGYKKKDISEIKKVLSKEGYFLGSDIYENSKTKLPLICSNGHNYNVSWDNWTNNNSRCPKCSQWGVSLQEDQLYRFIANTHVDAERSNRSLISPYELDIVIPSKKIAIEYCGLYWHSEKMGKTRNYHINKLKLCEEAGYRLITIFEDELISKPDIVYSRLNSILTSGALKKIHGRKCVIKDISNLEAKNFCVANHLQGYGVGNLIRLAAFFENEVVGAMTFSRPSIAKGAKKCVIDSWELNRFCSKIGHTIPGLSSKMLAYFTKNYEFDCIFSYSDNRWSSGNLYEKIGFNFLGETGPNYWYFKNNHKRIHRFALRKTKDDPKDITEYSIREAQGWNRIWDCGNKKYILEKGLHK